MRLATMCRNYPFGCHGLPYSNEHYARLRYALASLVVLLARQGDIRHHRMISVARTNCRCCCHYAAYSGILLIVIIFRITRRIAHVAKGRLGQPLCNVATSSTCSTFGRQIRRRWAPVGRRRVIAIAVAFDHDVRPRRRRRQRRRRDRWRPRPRLHRRLRPRRAPRRSTCVPSKARDKQHR